MVIVDKPDEAPEIGRAVMKVVGASCFVPLESRRMFSVSRPGHSRRVRIVSFKTAEDADEFVPNRCGYVLLSPPRRFDTVVR